MGSLHKGKAAEIGDIYPVVRDGFDDRCVISRDPQFHPRPPLLLDILRRWLAAAHFFPGVGGGDHAEAKRGLGTAARTALAADREKKQENREVKQTLLLDHVCPHRLVIRG